MSTSALSVVAVRRAQGTLVEGSGESGESASGSSKPFSAISSHFYAIATAVTGVATLLASNMKYEYATPVQTMFLTFLTFGSYVWSANLPKTIVKIIHPLATSSILVLLGIQALSAATNRDFYDVLSMYRVGSMHPLKTGAGDIMLYLLNPSVVAFAVSVFSRRMVLVQNSVALIVAVLICSIGSMFATAGFVRLIQLGGNSPNGMIVRLSMIARNITTALAIALTNILRGDIGIAASVTCITGILGGTYGRTFLDFLRVADPVARGLAVGGSSLGLGVASLAGVEPEAFAISASSMILTSMAATSLGSIPLIRDALTQIATDAPQFQGKVMESVVKAAS